MTIFQDPEFWRKLSEAILAERQRRLDAFEYGNVKREEYDKQVGFLMGLRWVSEEAQHIVLQMNKPPKTREQEKVPND